MTKDELRKCIRMEKKKVSLADKKLRSQNIWAKVETTPEFKNAKVVLMYWSMDDEVFTHDFVQKWAADKTILLPVVDGDDLKIKAFKGIENLDCDNQFGIGEPQGEDFDNTDSIDLIIVPGVAFDKNKNRMGRGRGYYDKLLSTSKAFKIGVGFDFQVLDIVPTEEFDIPMNRIVAESNIY